MIELNGGVAQLGEHCLCKAGVRGSSPLTSTFFIRIRMSHVAQTNKKEANLFLVGSNEYRPGADS
jgi:hypothetical protein